MKFDLKLLESIAAANDIVDIISAHVPLKRSGPTFRGNCPFHQAKTPSFHVNPARQVYHCFGCGAHGSIFRWLMEIERIDFETAVRKLAERGGIKVEPL
jgi:DNA primase